MSGTELDTNPPTENEPDFSAGIIPWAVALCLITLAAWMLIGPEILDSVVLDISEVQPESLRVIPISDMSTDPRRENVGNPPMITIGGIKRRCDDCHKLFTSPAETTRPLYQHTHIVLNHGMNDRCFNCHDRDNRDRLTLRGTTTIPYVEVSRLCAKCHGLTYRDWQKGMHGRTNGYWDISQGTQVRLECIQCHNPHSPAYPQFKPLPPPHTLRLNDKDHKEDLHMEVIEEIDPLRKWRHMVRGVSPKPDSVGKENQEGTNEKTESGSEQSTGSDNQNTTADDYSNNNEEGG